MQVADWISTAAMQLQKFACGGMRIFLLFENWMCRFDPHCVPRRPGVSYATVLLQQSTVQISICGTCRQAQIAPSKSREGIRWRLV